MAAAARTVRVVSYNVLSSTLTDSHAFVKPALLASDFRLASLLRKLAPEVSRDAVICLQEVSIEWLGPLHAYFARENYTYLAAQGGAAHSGFMGCGIAVPLRAYELLDARVVRLGDTKPRGPPPPPPGLLARALAWLRPQRDKRESPWELSRRRYNQLPSVRLRHRGGGAGGGAAADDFAISCYHMPCAYYNPPLMSLHCALAAQHAHAFARGARYVLAGDWNIKPGTAQYRLLTEGSSDREVPAPEFPGDPYSLAVAPLRSLYAAVNGAEPRFTNFARGAGAPEPFIETCVVERRRQEPVAFISPPYLAPPPRPRARARRLDYIFFSPGWRALDALPLPAAPELVGGPLPTETEPSDHLLIAGTLAFDAAAPAPTASP